MHTNNFRVVHVRFIEKASLVVIAGLKQFTDSNTSTEENKRIREERTVFPT
ncbi:hypothetical protein D9M69_700010 [compost metagenome]